MRPIDSYSCFFHDVTSPSRRLQTGYKGRGSRYNTFKTNKDLQD